MTIAIDDCGADRKWPEGTPRTDAQASIRMVRIAGHPAEIETVGAEFARQLERELNAALVELSAIKGSSENLNNLLRSVADYYLPHYETRTALTEEEARKHGVRIGDTYRARHEPPLRLGRDT